MHINVTDLMEGSNSENNVTSQVFAPLVHTRDGSSALGEWLTEEDGARVRSATLFWYPLRDTIENWYYNYNGDRRGIIPLWPGYQGLFTALGFPQDAILSLPPGHLKNCDWRPARERDFYAEVVAELASTEFDAAFNVDVDGREHLFPTEVKWLSPLGSGVRGLSQVQRAVALALWLKQLYPQTEVAYTVCSRNSKHTEGTFEHFLGDPGWPEMPDSFTEPMEQLVSHLQAAVEAGHVKLLSRSWESLGSAISNHISLTEVVALCNVTGSGESIEASRPA